MSKILVTTDASELGQKAVAHAQALAQALNAELVVLSVVPELTPAVVSQYAYVPPITPEELAAEEAQLRAQLERTLRTITSGVMKRMSEAPKRQPGRGSRRPSPPERTLLAGLSGG